MEAFAKNIFKNFNGLMTTNEDYKEPIQLYIILQKLKKNLKKV